MMDLVYILGRGSSWADNEIRYSLRSAERFFPHRKVFIIGERPRFLQNIIHIPFPDTSKVKTVNGVNKIMRAAEEPQVSRYFVLMNDDFFFLKPTKHIPWYCKGTCHEIIEEHPSRDGAYYQMLVKTERYLQKLGIKTPKDFTIHAPLVYGKKELLDLRRKVNKKLRNFSLRTLYGNIMRKRGKVTADFKLRSMSEMPYYISRSEGLLSISDGMVRESTFREWLVNMFPRPSRYEITNKVNASTQHQRYKTI